MTDILNNIAERDLDENIGNPVDNSIYRFTGIRCCIFEDENTAKDKLNSMPITKKYGDTFSDGLKTHYLHTWDDGERYLKKCPNCGAYFLVQKSEYHGAEDSYYTDWFQVEGEEHAELLNEKLNGFEIERKYHTFAFFSTNGEFYKTLL